MFKFFRKNKYDLPTFVVVYFPDHYSDEIYNDLNKVLRLNKPENVILLLVGEERDDIKVDYFYPDKQENQK